MNRIALLLLLCCQLAISQRREIKGTILNVLDDPQPGITIFNQNSMDGTVTNTAGLFTIEAQVADKIIIQALQYDPFTLIVTEATFKDPDIVIRLREGVNVLREVVLNNNQLMVEVEVNREVNKTLDNAGDAIYSIPQIDRMENTFSDRVRQPEDYPLRNIAAEQSALRMNGVPLLGILLAIVNEIVPLNLTLSNKQEAVQVRLDQEIQSSQLRTEDLTNFLEIEKDELSRFLYFANEGGFNSALLQPENEIALLQFLSEQAALYKKIQQEELLLKNKQQ